MFPTKVDITYWVMEVEWKERFPRSGPEVTEIAVGSIPKLRIGEFPFFVVCILVEKNNSDVNIWILWLQHSKPWNFPTSPQRKYPTNSVNLGEFSNSGEEWEASLLSLSIAWNITETLSKSLSAVVSDIIVKWQNEWRDKQDDTLVRKEDVGVIFGH